jgi:hypothetical protein
MRNVVAEPLECGSAESPIIGWPASQRPGRRCNHHVSGSAPGRLTDDRLLLRRTRTEEIEVCLRDNISERHETGH